MLSHSVASDSVWLWTVAHQAPLSVGFSRQEYSSRFPCLPSGDLPNPGTEPRSPAFQADSLPAEPQEKPKNTGVGSLSLLQGNLATQESNRSLLHCSHILYQRSHPGSTENVLLVCAKCCSNQSRHTTHTHTHTHTSFWNLLVVWILRNFVEFFFLFNFLNFLFYSGVLLIHHVILVSGVRQSDSVIHTHVSILSQSLLLHSIEQSSLCYTVSPCFCSSWWQLPRVE